MVNDIIVESMDLTYKDEEKSTLRVESRDRTWDLTFREAFEVLGYRFRRDGKGFQGAERTMRKGLRSW